ncbi:sugar nucleotide-binding protein [Candidatus Pacearchaeota archaeon]|nr:sugar nucleotide-binding protein [Candidatus Pacearchaeota archaeon]
MADISRLLICGGEGLIGRNIPFGIKVSRHELDVLKRDHIKRAFEKYNPSGILYLASVNLRDSEKDPMHAYRVNVIGINNIAEEATDAKIPMIIVSSGAVFNGSLHDKFNEVTNPDPQNIYGQTKYLAEIVARWSSPDNLVVRTGWLFGGLSTKDRKGGFDIMIEKTSKGEDVKASSDQYGSPTYSKDFFLALRESIEKNMSGIVHIVNDGAASALDIVNEVKSLTGSRSVITPASARDIPGPKRSASEAMVSNVFYLRSWKEALREYLNV